MRTLVRIQSPRAAELLRLKDGLKLVTGTYRARFAAAAELLRLKDGLKPESSGAKRDFLLGC